MDVRTTRRAATRQAILVLAARAFLDNGFANTSMSAIAAALGGSKRTLWAHFASKEELFAAVLEFVSHRDTLRLRLDAQAPIRDSLNTFCFTLITVMTEPDSVDFHRLVQSECKRFPELGPIFFEQAFKPIRALLTDYICEQGNLGRWDCANPIAAAELFLSLCIGGSHRRMLWGYARPTLPEIEAEARQVVDALFKIYPLKFTESADT